MANDSTNWSLGANLGIPTGGKRGGKGRGAGAGGSGNVSTSASDGVVFQDGYSTSQSDRSNLTSDSRNSKSLDISDETRRESGVYARDGSFTRSESFSEDRSYRDDLVEQVRSIDRQLSEIDEASRTLSSTWTTREGGGATISQDMSQIIASRYYDEAALARSEGLEVPLNPNQTDITPTQMSGRNLVVDRILDRYIDETMAPVRDEMLPPSEVMGPVQGPSNFVEGDLELPSRGGRRSNSGAGGVTEDRFEQAERLIEEGRADVKARRQSSQQNYGQGVIGASDLGERAAESQRRRWFSDRDQKK
ncbi:hypothetical protein [Erythrobacter sp.]|uniref:hypothetical protein n=1 Tax=Erythrobacter sp. TaxID=1042 RepID=UPI002EC3463C|nr:hypothetical protein [Erythrobacter sp.]